MVGQVLLGKYKVMRPLDEGGMCRIFVAKQLDQAREVVVKVLKPEYANQAKAREHFRREIYILSKFQHPNAVAYYDADGNDPKGPFLVMEYLRGADLGVLLARDGRFAPDRTGRLLAQLCDVLQAAHDAGVVHRDLKPGNVFILYPGTPQETVKLMDFGLAKLASHLYIAPEEVALLGETLTAAGTPEYMAPEQIRGLDVDRRSDLYALGVVMYELLTGKRPFIRSSVEALLLAHTDDDPPPFADHALPEPVAPAIEQVVRRCLEKVPERRYDQAVELILAYEKALGRRLTQGRTYGVPPPAAETPRDRASAALQKARALLGREPGSGSDPGTEPRPTPGSEQGLRRRPTSGSEHGRRLATLEAPVRPSQGDPNVVEHSLEANMPEAIAIVKLKGFIFDLGGEVIESVPGMIRVRLGKVAKKETGVLAWLTGSKSQAQPTFPPTDVELHMARRDLRQPGQLTITIQLRPADRAPATPAWRELCQQVARQLQAYLMGR